LFILAPEKPKISRSYLKDNLVNHNLLVMADTCEDLHILRAKEPRFLASTTFPFQLLAINEALLQLFATSNTDSLRDIIFADILKDTLLEETFTKAADGLESECTTFLSGHENPMHVHVKPVVIEQNQTILCELKPIDYCTQVGPSSEAQAIFSCLSPWLVNDVNEQWCELWGCSKDEVLGQSIEDLFGPMTNEQELAGLLDMARRGLNNECEFTSSRATAKPACIVKLRSRPLFHRGAPYTHFAVEATLSSAPRGDWVEDRPTICSCFAALHMSDNPPGDSSSAAARPRAFAELVLPLPPDAHRRACVALLRRLRALGLVRGWRREGGALRIRADAEALAGLAGARPLDAAGAGAWLHRLAEAARTACAGSRRSGGLRASPARAGPPPAAAAAEEEAAEATDFSFLSCDAAHGSPQLVPAN
jgi:hypothetical protein